MILKLDDYKEMKRQEMLKSLMAGGLIDEGLDIILIDMFVNSGTELLVDIGCNQGNFIDLKKQRYPKLNVLAFEPDTRIFNATYDKYKDLKDVVMYNIGISNKPGNMKFFIEGDTTQTSVKYSNSKNYMITKTEKLDKYYNYIKKFKNPFVKIDAEGLEPEIIYSMKKIIRNTPNMSLFFEYSYKWNYNEKETYKLFQFLDQEGFTLYRLNAFGIERIPKMYYNYLMDYHFSNIFAIKNYEMDKSRLFYLDSKYGKNECIPLIFEREMIERKDD